MPIVTGNFTLDLTKLPSYSEKLGVSFDSRVVNGKNRLLFIHPSKGPDFEPTYVRYAAGLILTLGDGTVAKLAGQLVVTGQRLIGMITDGSVGDGVLDQASGSVYAFALDLDDIHPVEIRTNWRGKPVEAVIRSKEDQKLAFLLQVFSVVASLTNDGRMAYSSLPDLLNRLTAEGRANLQKAL